MANVNTKELVIKEKTGTWSQSRKLLMECENNHNNGYAMKYSKNLNNVYKLMRWLEESNKIENHAIEKDSKIYIPQGLCDYIKIIGTEIPLSKDCEYTQEDFEIKYEDTLIFKHKSLPGKSRNNKTQDAEDILSGDMNAEEIVERNPMLSPFFEELFYFKSLRETVAKDLISKGGSTNSSIYFQKIQERIEALLVSIVERSRQEMESLIRLCSVKDWEELAMRLYRRFCSNDSSDYKDDALLNKLFVGHEKTQTCIKEFKERFKMYLKKYDYDIASFNIGEFQNSIYGEYEKERGEEGVSRPKFVSRVKDGPWGPMLCFHDTQGFTVHAKEIKIERNKFSCKLIFDFYDHFGLDSNDLESFDRYPVLRTGFQGWYILQHFNEHETGCKAFVDYAHHEGAMEVEIEGNE